MKPTKIIARPTVAGGTPGNVKLYECDDGRCYTQRELAVKIGLSPSALSSRMLRYGWQHPDLLKPRQKTREPEMLGDDIITADPECVKLGTTQRPHNLEKIPSMTAYEKELYGCKEERREN